MSTPALSVLTNAELEAVHEAALLVLERVGVVVEEQSLLAQLAGAGARVERDASLARLPRELVEWALGQAPKAFVLYGRDGSELRLGEGHYYHLSGSGDLKVLEYPGYRLREPALLDLVAFTRLADALPLIAGVTPQVSIIEPGSPADLEDLHVYQMMVTNTTKHCAVAPRSGVGAQMWLDIGRILAGEAGIRQWPVISQCAASSSPLFWDRESARVLITGARAGMPTILMSGPISAMSGPITLAGSLVSSSAEVLSGVVMAQLLKPGLPVIWAGIGSPILDMRTLDLAAGGPEYALTTIAGAQMARYHGIPSYSCAPWVDAKLPGMQAGVEKMGAWLASVAAGVDIGINAGSLSKTTVASREQMVIDHEVLRWLHRFKAGIAVTPESLAVEAFDRVGPRGSFMLDPHTLANLRSGENLYLELFDRSATGSEAPDLMERAHQVVAELVERTPVLPNATLEQLSRYVQQQEREIADRGAGPSG